jgi:predicted ATPase
MDYIEIKGYKSIKELHLELKPVNVLIGANGAGKSNFISFFSFLNTAYNQQLKSFVAGKGGVDKFLYNGRKQTSKIQSKISFNEGVNHYGFTLAAGDNSFVVMEENLGYNRDDWNISRSGFELEIRSNAMLRANYINKYLSGLKVYHFHETGKNSPFNKDAKINDYYTLQSQGANLAAFLYNLKQNDIIIYTRIVKVIQSVAPYFHDFDLQPNGEGSEYIRLAWRDNYSENLYGATDLSDGTIRFIALTTLFLQPDPPSVIIIDEPELGLHPFAISKLAGLVKSAASRGTQVILSTQSVELVNYFDLEDIITVDNVEGASIFERLHSDEFSVWLEDYTVGDMWQQNILNKGFPNK